MMSRQIFILLSIAITAMSISNVQAIPTDVCRTYNTSGVPPPAANQQLQGVTLNDTLFLLCLNERQLLDKPGVEVVVVIGRTGVGKSYLTEFLSEKLHGNGAALNPQSIDNSNIITRSNTLIPIWYRKNKTEFLFLDCPGFEDTRGPEHDIAAAHFNQLLLNRAGKVKLLLVEAYANLIKGGEKTALPNLLRHVTTLVKDVRKFNGSLALFASKVDRSANEAQVLNNITNYLRSARNNTAREPEIDLLDILLLGHNTSMSRLGFMRMLNKNDVNSKDMVGNKQSMDWVMNNLTVAEVQDGDFGYAISDSSALSIYQLADQITGGVNSNIDSLTRNVWATKVSTVGFALAYSYLFDVKEELQKSNDLGKFLDGTVPQLTAQLNVTFAQTTINNTRVYYDYLTFFQKVSNNRVVPDKWSRIYDTAELNSMYVTNRCFGNHTQQTQQTQTTQQTSASLKNQISKSVFYMSTIALFCINSIKK